ncbi:MAG: vanadium-dependent haloperoxidase [Verrucomicrobiia bacterium]
MKTLGALVGSSRTPEQTQIAYIWAGNFFAQVNDILRYLAQTHLECSGDRARLFALTWLAGADAIISTWNNKAVFPTWRPITAINEGNNDGNPRTIGDPNWQPLINTPNYPEHCSGANALMASTTKSMALFFGTDRMTFPVTTTHPNADPNTRTYTRISDVQTDVIEARILQGIHYRTADLEGRKLGRGVAKWVFKHALRPLREHHHDCNLHDCDDDDDDNDQNED